MIKRKGRAPSSQARFCTEELKIKPFAGFVRGLQARGFDTVVFVGVRAEESSQRASLPAVSQSTEYNCLIARPILPWLIADVLAIHARHGIPLNPLYTQGQTRVGCMPCIMSNKQDLKAIAQRFPEVFDKVAALEERVGRTFWTAGDVPARACSREVETKDGRRVRVPVAEDVKRWAMTGRGGVQNLIPFPPSRCQSAYGLCE